MSAMVSLNCIVSIWVTTNFGFTRLALFLTESINIDIVADFYAIIIGAFIIWWFVAILGLLLVRCSMRLLHPPSCSWPR